MGFFRVLWTKGNLIRRHWIGIKFSIACACKGYKCTSDTKTFDSNVKQNVLDDEKR